MASLKGWLLQFPFSIFISFVLLFRPGRLSLCFYTLFALCLIIPFAQFKKGGSVGLI
jgi:hypothetical protein